jgi:hypothetical protein
VVVSDQQTNDLIKDLGGGLILRRGVPTDGEQLSAFNARIHMEEESVQPDQRISEWTNDLISRPHPTTNAADFTIVEDINSGQIVSSLVLISQTWSYAGIDIQVGRPELVGTNPAYRECGLVRAQFETIHEWSADRGELMQGITGIPYYYRQFGYEMGLELGGGRSGFIQQIPKLEGDEPFSLRQAEHSDILFLVGLSSESNQRYLVRCVRDENVWRYELSGRSPQNVNKSVIKIIESKTDGALGFITHPPYRWGGMMAVTGYEITPGVSWASVTPTVMRYLKSVGKEYPPEYGKEKELETYGFWLGSSHPVYDVIPDKLPKTKDPYAWFLRVPDLPKFLQQIAPQLEARLDASPLVGHNGEIKITFYRSGLRLVFENGRIAVVEDWKPEPDRYSGNAGFPDLTFLQLVFGYRSLSELKYAFADCWSKGDQTGVLLDILFPKMASSVWPIS